MIRRLLGNVAGQAVGQAIGSATGIPMGDVIGRKAGQQLGTQGYVNPYQLGQDMVLDNTDKIVDTASEKIQQKSKDLFPEGFFRFAEGGPVSELARINLGELGGRGPGDSFSAVHAPVSILANGEAGVSAIPQGEDPTSYRYSQAQADALAGDGYEAIRNFSNDDVTSLDTTKTDRDYTVPQDWFGIGQPGQGGFQTSGSAQDYTPGNFNIIGGNTEGYKGSSAVATGLGLKDYSELGTMDVGGFKVGILPGQTIAGAIADPLIGYKELDIPEAAQTVTGTRGSFEPGAFSDDTTTDVSGGATGSNVATNQAGDKVSLGYGYGQVDPAIAAASGFTAGDTYTVPAIDAPPTAQQLEAEVIARQEAAAQAEVERLQQEAADRALREQELRREAEEAAAQAERERAAEAARIEAERQAEIERQAAAARAEQERRRQAEAEAARQAAAKKAAEEAARRAAIANQINSQSDYESDSAQSNPAYVAPSARPTTSPAQRGGFSTVSSSSSDDSSSGGK